MKSTLNIEKQKTKILKDNYKSRETSKSPPGSPARKTVRSGSVETIGNASMRKQSLMKKPSFTIGPAPCVAETLFSNYERIKKDQTRLLLRAQVMGEEMYAPAWGIMPVTRYVPSRQLMQRMIRRACYLPANFVEFEKLEDDFFRE